MMKIDCESLPPGFGGFCGRCNWFLGISFVQEDSVSLCECPFLRLLITSGVMWHGMDHYDWLN